MRILVIHEVDFVTKVVYEWQEFPEALARAGHDVCVLDYDSHSGWADLRRWGLGPKRTITSWRLDETTRFELLRMIGPPIPGVRRIYAALASWTVMRRVFAECRPDAVLLYAVPTCGLAAVNAARRSGVPALFRSIDVLSQLVPRALGFGVDVLERAVYSTCDGVLVANPRLTDYVHRMSGGTAKTSLLLSPIDTDLFTSSSHARSEVRNRYGIAPDARVVVFVGSLFRFIGLKRLLASWEHILSSVPDAHLLIVGGGPTETRLRRIANRLSHPASVTFTGMRPYHEIPDLISAADVGVCPFEITPVTSDVNPIKVMQYLSCAIPCVCTPLEGTIQVLPESESGVLYASPGEDLARALAALLSDASRRADLGAAGRRWVVDHHGLPALVQQLAEALADAGGGHARATSASR